MQLWHRGAVLALGLLLAGSTPLAMTAHAMSAHDDYDLTGQIQVTMSAKGAINDEHCTSDAGAVVDLTTHIAKITFAQTCQTLIPGGTRRTTYAFTIDPAHLHDGRPDVPVGGPKKQFTGAVITSDVPEAIHVLVGQDGAGHVLGASVPSFEVKVVTIWTTALKQVTKAVGVSTVAIGIPADLVGTSAAGADGSTISFDGKWTSPKSYHFNDRPGTLQVDWNVQTRPTAPAQ